MHLFKKSLRAKLVLFFVLAGFVSLSLLGGVIYQLVLTSEMTTIKNQLGATAAFVAESIDAQEHQALEVGSEDTDLYRAMLTRLREFREISGLTFLYTVKAHSSESVQFVLDTDDTVDQAQIGDLYPNQKDIATAFSGKSNVSEKPMTDEWGTFLSGFAPIMDTNGAVIAVVGADISIEHINALKTKLFFVILLGLLCGLIVMVVISLRISASISKPVISLMRSMKQAEDGDLRTRTVVSSQDELGQLMASFNRLMERTGQTINSIQTTMDSLRSASDEMTGISDTMVACSEETSNKTTSGASWAADVSSAITNLDTSIKSVEKFMVNLSQSIESMSMTVKGLAQSTDMTATKVQNTASLVEGMTENISTSAASAKNVSGNVNEVVVAVKEINLSLNDVGKNCSRSMDITHKAKLKAVETSMVIEELNHAAKSVGKMVSAIRGIADKTNMLALNAAIEAAGAGEAGKGFAVVANEVKELAKQTSAATEDISRQIGEMNRQMAIAIRAVTEITTVVEEVDVINNTIASAVTEQSAITGAISHAAVNAADKVSRIGIDIDDIHQKAKHVAGNSEEASHAVSSIAKSTVDFSDIAKGAANSIEEAASNIRHIAQMSRTISGGASDIQRTMEDINASSEEVTAGAEETQNAASKLDLLAKELGRLVSQFRL